MRKHLSCKTLDDCLWYQRIIGQRLVHFQIVHLGQQEDTNLLLVDLVYHLHQSEGNLVAGLSNKHHLPLLVLQVTVFLDDHHITHYIQLFPNSGGLVLFTRSNHIKAIFPCAPSCKPSARPPSSPSSCLSICTPWPWTCLCTFHTGLVVITRSTYSRPWSCSCLKSIY